MKRHVEKRQKRFKELLKNNLMSVVLLFLMISVISVIAGDVIVKEGNVEVEQDLQVGNVTLNYSTSTGTGVEKDYLSLDGTGDYVGISKIVINVTNKYTASIWFRLINNFNTANVHTAIWQGSSFGIRGYKSGKITADFYSGTWRTLDSGVVPSGGVWYHVVQTYNGSTVKVYVNGVEKNSANYVIDGSNSNLMIGGQTSEPGVNYLNGTIDEVMIFNASLNSSDILNIYNSGRNSGSYTGSKSGYLISHWRFDDGTANDDKGRNNGTLYGDASVEQSTAGNATEVLTIDKNLDVLGDITANSYSDHTLAWSETENDALEAVLGIKSKDGNIDHSSLPDIARTKTGRSLGGMITVLVEAVKGVFNRIEDLEQENQMLKDELCKKDDSYSWC